MSVYIIVNYDVVDPAGYADYVSRALPILLEHGGELLVANGETTPMEGEARSVHVVLRFASEEAALRWYSHPAYVAVKKIRLASCNNISMVLAKQYEPASP